jgi:hypothetical protein
MARQFNGSWAKTPDEQGKMVFSSAAGKATKIDCHAAVGGKDVWAKMTPSGRFLLGYGVKQWIMDPLGSKSGAEWDATFAERVSMVVTGQAGGDSLPYLCEAIARVKNITVEKVRETVFAPTVTAEQRKAWYNAPKVQAAVTLIQDEARRTRAEAVLATAGDDDGLASFNPPKGK